MAEQKAIRGKGPYHSQHGEDELLDQFFSKASGVAIEVGGYDGVTLSNTYFFEQIGWSTAIVEPIPELAERIRRNRKCPVFNCAAGAKPGQIKFQVAEGAEHLELLSSAHNDPNLVSVVGQRGGRLREITVPVRTLDSIVEELAIKPCGIDFITIDVEGAEPEVLRSFTASKWRPRFIIVEDNSFGLDLESPAILKSHGYVRVKSTKCNFWYAHRDDKEFAGGFAIIGEKLKALRARIFLGAMPTIAKKIIPHFLHQTLKNVWRGLRSRLFE